MGAFKTLNDEIAAIVGIMDDCTYLRMTLGEANKAMNKTKVSDCFVVHYDQTPSSSMRSDGSYTYKIIPIEILFLYKNTRIDDKLIDVDTLVDLAENKADEFYDLLIQSPVIETMAELDDPETERLPAFKRMDALTSGILFTWDVPIPRNTYYCGS